VGICCVVLSGFVVCERSGAGLLGRIPNCIRIEIRKPYTISQLRYAAQGVWLIVDMCVSSKASALPTTLRCDLSPDPPFSKSRCTLTALIHEYSQVFASCNPLPSQRRYHCCTRGIRTTRAHRYHRIPSSTHLLNARALAHSPFPPNKVQQS
jgi:hypothetical protein